MQNRVLSKRYVKNAALHQCCSTHIGIGGGEGVSYLTHPLVFGKSL